MSKKLANGWKECKLGDVCDFINGDRGKNYPSGNDIVAEGIPFINAGHIQNNKINFENMNFVTKEKFESLGSGKVQKDDIVYCLRGSLGKNGIIDIDEGAIASSLVIIRPQKNIINHKYLMYLLNSKSIKEQQIRANNGSSQPNLSASSVKQFKIYLSYLEEQERIVSILERAESAIQKRKECNRLLDELVKSRFIEMFGSPKSNPYNFDIVPFNDITEYMGDIGSNGANAVISANLKMSDTEDYALMIRTLNFTSNDFENNAKYVSKEVYDFFKKSQVFGGELIFNKIGSAGINFLMPYLNRPVSLGLNQIMVRTNEKVNTVYLHTLLNTDYGKHEISRRVQGAVTKSITKGAIKEIPIILPSIELQSEFADFVKQVDKLKFEMEASLKELENNFNSLMQRAFKGEL